MANADKPGHREFCEPCATGRPQRCTSKRNSEEISVTVLRGVHLGDSLALVQFRGGAGLWKTTWITVWSVLARWGLSTVVHEIPKPARLLESLVHTAAHTHLSWG